MPLYFFRSLLILSFGIVLGCTPTAPDLSQKPVVDVNGRTMNAKEFADELLLKLRSIDSILARKPENLSQAKKQIINEFIIAAVLEIWGEQNSLTVNEEDVEKAYSELAKSYPDRSTLNETLAKEGIDTLTWKKRQRRKILQQRVFEKLAKEIPDPSEPEIKKYYEDHKFEFSRGEAVQLRQIVTDSEAAAREIKKQIRKRKITFEEAAKKFSMAPEAEKEGLIGWIERGTIEVFDKAFELPKGRISAVLQSPYGWHIFRVEKRRKAQNIPFKKAIPQIKKRLRLRREQAKFTGWLDNQIRQSTVKINEDLVNAIWIENKKSTL